MGIRVGIGECESEEGNIGGGAGGDVGYQIRN